MPCSACGKSKNSTFKSPKTFILGRKSIKSVSLNNIKRHKISTTHNQIKYRGHSTLFLLGRR